MAAPLEKVAWVIGVAVSKRPLEVWYAQPPSNRHKVIIATYRISLILECQGR